MQTIATKVKPVPEGYHSSPILTVEGASSLISFLKQGFDAKEEEVYKGRDGRVILLN